MNEHARLINGRVAPTTGPAIENFRQTARHDATQGLSRLLEPDKRKPSFDTGEFLSVATAATLLRLNPASIYKWIRNGEVPAFGRRGYYRVRIEDLLPPVIPVKGGEGK
jgi:excisionase family DNA binding protein